MAEIATQCCISRMFAVQWRGYLSSRHCFSVISENIAVYNTLPKAQFFGLHFCCGHYQMYWSSFNHWCS